MKVPQCICGKENFDILIAGDYSFFRVKGKPVPFQALKCLSCGLVLTNPLPSTDISDENASNSDEEVFESPLHTKSSAYRISRLKPYLYSSTRILEIGCSTGKLVEMAMHNGVSESIGVEISTRAATYGRKLARDIKTRYLTECNFPSNYFDIIQAHHVIEHIPNLRETLNEIHRILKPNGLFYITVPRHNSIFASSLNWSGWFPQEHFWHFSEKTLSNLLAQHGFQLKSYSCPLQTEFDTQKNLFYPFKKIVKFAAKQLNLGDTVEAFFLKI